VIVACVAGILQPVVTRTASFVCVLAGPFLSIFFEQSARLPYDHQLQSFHRAALATLACYGVLLLVSFLTKGERDADRERYTWWRFKHERLAGQATSRPWWQRDKLWATVLVASFPAMTIVQLDGVEVVASFLTQRSYRAAYCDFLLPVTRASQKETLARFKRAGELGKYRGLRVSGIADLGFLEEFPLLLYLEVLDQKHVDISGLAHLSNLRGLRLESPAAGIDFGWFPELEVFVGDWHPDNRNLPAARELRQLRVWHFNPRAALDCAAARSSNQDANRAVDKQAKGLSRERTW
jgi:hypothetical protein